MSNPSNGTTRTNGGIADLSMSERHRLLAAERRRLVLRILAGEPPPFSLERLAAEVAVRETAGGTVDEQTRKRVEIALHHDHLPELAAAGVLTYDAESNRIEPGG